MSLSLSFYYLFVFLYTFIPSLLPLSLTPPLPSLPPLLSFSLFVVGAPPKTVYKICVCVCELPN